MSMFVAPAPWNAYSILFSGELIALNPVLPNHACKIRLAHNSKRYQSDAPPSLICCTSTRLLFRLFIFVDSFRLHIHISSHVITSSSQEPSFHIPLLPRSLQACQLPGSDTAEEVAAAQGPAPVESAPLDSLGDIVSVGVEAAWRLELAAATGISAVLFA